MPSFTEPTSRTFCWADLLTTDKKAARDFYAAVLGWRFTDIPGPMAYAVANVEGGMTAGLMDLPPAARQAGAPPHWQPYVAVDDVERTVARAVGLGGVVIAPVMTMDAGTMAVVADPTGGVFALWHPARSMGITVQGEPGGIGWTELMTTDVDAARTFYTSLFDWTFDEMPMPTGPYTLLKKDGVGIAGLMKLPSEDPGGRSFWSVYFVVEDADAAFETAAAHGGRIAMPLMDVPDVGRFGFLVDPQGAMFAVIRMEMPAA